MRPDDADPALLKVAEAIADGRPVDWEKEAAVRLDLKPQLGRLRVIESLAAASSDPPLAVGSDSPKSDSVATTVVPTLVPASTARCRWGKLEILEKLDHGGFGEVYRAYDPDLQHEVALKLRRPGPARPGHDERTFLEEARRLARVRHDNVVLVHGAEQHDGQVGLWTELVDGKTLETCLSEQGPFGAGEAARIGVDLCRALAAVHAAGLVHRDIKTSNVMRERGGRIVLLDFGSVSEAATLQQGSTRQDAQGTLMFMAPEALLKREAPRPINDIYSLGVLLYRLVSGRFPVPALDLPELIEKHRKGEYVPLRDVRADLPTAFVQVVERALSPDPAQRHASAGLMERALVAAPPVQTAPVPPMAPEQAPPEDRKRRPRLMVRIAFYLVSVIALASVGLFLLPTVPSPVPLTVEAALFREAGRTQERLASGAQVRPEDRLFLELRSSQALHVYVMNEDEQGDTFVLFPSGTDLVNPLAAGRMHRLPGSLGGEAQSWVVTSPGVREAILVVASRRPLVELEQEMAKLPRAARGRSIVYHRLGPEDLGRVVRGIGGMAGAPPAEGGGRLADLARALARRKESGDVWLELIHLENPGS